jgi:hypothetical protein
VKVGDIAPKRFVNYGVAVAAVVPLSFTGQAGAPMTEAPAVRAPARSSVSSESGRWLDDEWAGMKSALATVLLRIPVNPLADQRWYETASDAMYPSGRDVELLDVQIADDDSSAAFNFTDTDFDVWTG